MALSQDQRASLLAAKLRTLIVENGPEWACSIDPLAPAPFGAGAAFLSGNTAWLLVAQRPADPGYIDDMGGPARSANPSGWLSGAVLWAHRNSIRVLHVMLDEVSGADARRARLFATDFPASISLWHIVGRSIGIVAPTAFESVAPSEDDLTRFGPIITSAGADVVVDHGIIRAEVLGLEVARVVTDPDGSTHLEVGVGRHDRLANAMLGHATPTTAPSIEPTATDTAAADLPSDSDTNPLEQTSITGPTRTQPTDSETADPDPLDSEPTAPSESLTTDPGETQAQLPPLTGIAKSLANAVASVQGYRRPDAPSHPANQLVVGRWLRHAIVADPTLVGLDHATTLLTIESTRPSQLKEPLAAVAVSDDFVVGACVGSNLDGPLEAADVRSAVNPSAHLIVAVPPGNAFPALAQLCDLIPDVSLLVVADNWRGRTGIAVGRS